MDRTGRPSRGADRVRSMARDVTFRALWRTGYEVRRIDSDGWDPGNLAKPGIDPATLIDVGVGTGTPGLHEAFPRAHHVFVEPLARFEPQLKEMVARYGGEYHLAAAGASDGSAVMHVDKRVPMQSSFSYRTDGRSRSLEDHEVSVVTLDALRRANDWAPPFGLKVDTEGHEMEVVRGAQELLADTQFVIAELSLSERFAGQADFATFVAEMDRHGLRLCDILTSPRSHEHEIIHVDAYFRRGDPTAPDA